MGYLLKYCFSCSVLMLFFAPNIRAQRGIGLQKPSKASALEIKSTSKGLLIPRLELISLQSLAPVSGEASTSPKTNSLLIYNTATAPSNNIYPGFYYWRTDHQKWFRLATTGERLEPWNIQGTTDKSATNQDSIYIMNSVAIGKDNAAYNQNQVMLDVSGPIRGGQLEDTAIIGKNSIAIGEGVIASAKNAAAFGQGTEASNNYAFSIGKSTQASGYGATSMGRNTSAYGNYSLATGRYTKSGVYETSIGRYNAITQSNTEQWNPSDPVFEIGNGQNYNHRNNAMTVLKNGKVGIRIDGKDENAKPGETLDIGQGKVRIRELPNHSGMPDDSLVVSNSLGVLKTISPSAIQLEPWRDQITTEQTSLNTADIYQMGTVAIAKQKVLTVDSTFASLDVEGAVRTGNTYTDPSAPIGKNSLAAGEELTASGKNSTALGYRSEATMAGSFAGGGKPGFTGGHATGLNAFAFGRQTKASANYAVAFGYKTESSNFYAFSTNRDNKAAGNSSFAAGRDNEATGNYSTVFGRHNKGSTGFETVLGRYNSITSGNNSIGWSSGDPLFQIGNGTSDNNRHNALTILKDGWVGIGFDQKSNAGTEHEKLRVDGYIKADSLISVNNTYPDYVFDQYFAPDTLLDSTYTFLSLEQMAVFLRKHKHLPGLQPAAAVNRTAQGLYEINNTNLTVKLFEKIEELYLYTIEQADEINTLEEKLENLRREQCQQQNLKNEIRQLKRHNHENDKRLNRLENILKNQ